MVQQWERLFKVWALANNNLKPKMQVLKYQISQIMPPQ